MNFSTWKPLYRQIISDFNFSESKDQKAAFILNSLLRNHQGYIACSHLQPLLYNKTVVVVGASTQVQDQISSHMELINDSICLSADGATSALMNQNIIPEIIVTDLDGSIRDQLRANNNGSIMVVHAHGDNTSVIQEVLPKISGSVTGTVQTDPSDLSFVSNVGGFTDGDRAVFLADHFNAKRIICIGFDFHGPIGRYSNPQDKNLELKQRKLIWAERLINLLNDENQITFVDSSDRHRRE
jgi:hypothetical protein